MVEQMERFLYRGSSYEAYRCRVGSDTELLHRQCQADDPGHPLCFMTYSSDNAGMTTLLSSWTYSVSFDEHIQTTYYLLTPRQNLLLHSGGEHQTPVAPPREPRRQLPPRNVSVGNNSGTMSAPTSTSLDVLRAGSPMPRF